MKLSDFNYELPKELIAQYPAHARDASRMMVLDRKAGTVRHARFTDMASYLQKKDTVILNDSKVVPARLIFKRETGGKAEIFLLKKIRRNVYEALVRPASKLFPGKKIVNEEGSVVAEIVKNGEVGRLVKFADSINIENDLEEIGRVPLPPYIKRDPEDSDKERYQTVYAKKDGSTAAPTAGLHFTEETLQGIRNNNIDVSYVTLHVSYGTFAPVKVRYVEEHKMHREAFELPAGTQDIVRKTKARQGRILAVGTTTARVLEDKRDLLSGVKGQGSGVRDWTNFFIYPPYEFKIVDMLLTNFHLPGSTLLMLVSAFAGRKFILEAYREAVKERYRFYSYGDCMLII